jgi:tight adherence protein C
MPFLVLAALLLAAAAYLVSEVVTHPSRERRTAVKRAATYGRVRSTGAGLERLHFRQRVLLPATASLAGFALRLNPRVTQENISLRLMAAGMGRTVTPTMFLAAKSAGGIAGILLGFLGMAFVGPTLGFLLAIGFAAIGFIIPGFIVSRRARARRDEMRAQLPDALDLLAVSVEAGLAFDGALKKLSDRAGTPEISSFTRAIIQADQLGISLGRLLRVQAAESRLKRQAAAEEKAMKSPIKMLFPTVIFIFPAMFIVILGPSFLNLMTVFEF